MEFAVLCFVVLVVVPFLLWYRQHRINEHRRLLMLEKFPDEWKDILSANVPLYRFLTDRLKRDLHGFIHVFLDEKTFEGCQGLEITDEIRVTIAGQACVLMLNREPAFYPGLYSIVVYPSAYVSQQKAMRGAEIVEENSVRLGESWTQGTVVLAWDNVRKSAREYRSGQNVVLHEFAHQLDQEDGVADGAPILETSQQYKAWARVLGKEYAKLQRKARRRKKSLLDAYGATDPAEFFAVATETFFEKGKKMKRTHPELYEELKQYYKMDPAGWF